ncbi:DUF1983 domain-containing protein [Edwardsiella piscicida]|uniref:phage tail tip fiber protein n=1 Tax=Edwardsiella piscicida TaxID=1263550 RepID=UPI000D524D1A|nr:DUF1983 domain-containing protein [Edwardsiella piscicida]UCQ45948.1 DUF1983 domain-containing protein [Edwardsiella piscicida]
MSKRHAFRAGRSLDSLYENVELMTGQRGDGQDKAITARELVALGLARPLRGQGGSLQLRPGLGGQAWPDDRRRVDFPQAPQGLQVSGGFSAVLLEWRAPTYGGHALTEIYRHTQDNLADAVLVATSASVIYGDPVDPGWQGFYWIRFVNTAGVPGPFNAPAGTAAQTHPEIDAVVSLIAREINGSPLIAALASEQEAEQQALSETQENLRDIDRAGSQAFQSLWRQKNHVGDISAGIGIVAGSDPQGNVLSQVAIAATQFFIFDPNNPNDDGTYSFPFVVDGNSGRVVMTKAAIEQATIQILQAQRIVADEVMAGIRISAPYISAAQIYASEIISLGEPPTFSLTTDGVLSARHADISGTIHATSGALSRVTIDETCDVKEIRAESIKGDIVRCWTLLNGQTIVVEPAPFERRLVIPACVVSGATFESTSSHGDGNERRSFSYDGGYVNLVVDGATVRLCTQSGDGVSAGQWMSSLPRDTAVSIGYDGGNHSKNSNKDKQYYPDSLLLMAFKA